MVRGEHPDDDTGVQQKSAIHMYSLNPSSGASKSSAISIWPLKIFHGIFLLLRARRVSLATGLPWLAITISSPAAARLTSRERLLFASCIFTTVPIFPKLRLLSGLS